MSSATTHHSDVTAGSTPTRPTALSASRPLTVRVPHTDQATQSAGPIMARTSAVAFTAIESATSANSAGWRHPLLSRARAVRPISHGSAVHGSSSTDVRVAYCSTYGLMAYTNAATTGPAPPRGRRGSV